MLPEREGYRQTDRQTETGTERERERERDRDRDRETETETETETDIEGKRQRETERDKNRQTDRQTDRDRGSQRQNNRQRQTDTDTASNQGKKNCVCLFVFNRRESTRSSLTPFRRRNRCLKHSNHWFNSRRAEIAVSNTQIIGLIRGEHKQSKLGK